MEDVTILWQQQKYITPKRESGVSNQTLDKNIISVLRDNPGAFAAFSWDLQLYQNCCLNHVFAASVKILLVNPFPIPTTQQQIT